MRYDLHLHTHFSRCSNMEPRMLLKVAKERGLNGIAITDHNCIQGALACQRLNQDPDFEVIVGTEVLTPHGEVLGYYLTQEIESRDMFGAIDEIHSQGGIAVIAHPTAAFRNKLRLPYIELIGRVDGIEGFNGRSLFFEVGKVLRIAKKFGFGMTGGSDGHFYWEIGKGYTDFEGDLKHAIHKGQTIVGGSILYAPFSGFLSALRKFIFK